MARYLESPEHGSIPPDMAADCESCRGTKYVRAQGAQGKSMLASCPTCKGTGKVGEAVEQDPVEQSAEAAPTMDEDGNPHTQGSVEHSSSDDMSHAEIMGPHVEHGSAHVHGRGFPHRRGGMSRMPRHGMHG